MSQKQDAKKAEENAALFRHIKEYAEKTEADVANAQNTADPAKRILALLELQSSIRESKRDIWKRKEKLARERAAKSAATLGKRALLVLASIPVVTMIETLTADWTSKSSQKAEMMKLCAVTDIAAMEQRIDKCVTNIAALLEDTVAHSDLKDLSDSPHFTKAYKRHEPLRDRFEAAAAARQALGHGQAAPQPQAEEKPAQKRSGKTGTYQKFRNL